MSDPIHTPGSKKLDSFNRKQVAAYGKDLKPEHLGYDENSSAAQRKIDYEYYKGGIKEHQKPEWGG